MNNQSSMGSRTASGASFKDGKSMTPQQIKNEEDKEIYKSRPYNLWNLDAINEKLNTRGVSVSEILIYVPEFTGIIENENVAVAQARSQTNREPKKQSRVFQHGTLSDASTYAFEQPSTYINDTTDTTGADSKSTSSDVSVISSPPVDRYLGKATKSGKWVVKATNVIVKNDIDRTCKRHLPSNAGGDTSGSRLLVPGTSNAQDKVYLLSRGEGFTFRNKLVAARDMEEVMNNM